MDTEHLAKQLVLWMRDLVSATGYNGVVIGINDGINSSIAAALCHHTFPQNIFGVLIPYHNSREDTEHAQAVASKFSISTKIVTPGTVFDALLNVLPNDRGNPRWPASRLASVYLF